MFIMGKERSGTTLLQSMLNVHPNIVAPHESRIIIYMYSKYGKVKTWTEGILREFCDELYTETRFEQFWLINKDELLSILIRVKDELNYALIFKIIYSRFSPGKDIKIIFDKNPVYYLFMHELQVIYPDAKYIHIVRDYRDNIISHRKAMLVKNVADLAYRWLIVNEYIEEAKKKSRGNWFTLKYEDLVNEPIKCLEDVCLFIGLPFDEAMVNGFNSKLSHVFESNKDNKKFMRFHSSIYNPISNDKIGKWKKELSAGDIQVIEAIAGQYGKQQYNYEITMPYKKVSLFIRIKVRVVFVFFREVFIALQKYHFIYKGLRFFVRIAEKNT